MRAEAVKKRRQKAQRKGIFAEYLAAIFLVCKGYKILQFRYKSHLGEIDVIAKTGRTIVFVEVKSRQDLSSALDAVSYETQHRIIAASEIWLSRRPVADYSYRYDIIAICPWRLPHHIANAF